MPQITKQKLEAELANVDRQMNDATRIVHQATGAKMALQMMLRELDAPDPPEDMSNGEDSHPGEVEGEAA